MNEFMTSEYYFFRHSILAVEGSALYCICVEVAIRTQLSLNMVYHSFFMCSLSMRM